MPCATPTPPAALDLDAAIVEVVGSGTVKVPPYPAVALRVDKLVKRDDYGLHELAQLVASDQALAADALRCANSAFYARAAPVTTLAQALGRIGGRDMARLAVASALGSHARAAGPLASLKRRIWLDGLASAALCQELARRRGLDVEEAFLCGLLHDFGRMIAVACIEEILSTRAGQRAMSLEHWLEVVDRYHVELGLVLAARWELPQMVSDVISLHHSDDCQGAAEPRMVELTQATDQVVRMLGESISLTAEDLGINSLLTGPECELVARVLDRLPGFIASFEGDGPAAPAGHSLVEPEAPSEEIMTGPKAVDFPVEIAAGRDKRIYRAMGIATNNLMVNGPTPLPENVLLQIELRSTPPLTCWASAKVSWPENGGHTVLLQPFALNGKAHDSWKELLRRTVD